MTEPTIRDPISATHPLFVAMLPHRDTGSVDRLHQRHFVPDLCAGEVQEHGVDRQARRNVPTPVAARAVGHDHAPTRHQVLIRVGVLVVLARTSIADR